MTTPSALDALRCCFSEMKRNSFDMDNWSCDDGHSSFYAALSPDERFSLRVYYVYANRNTPYTGMVGLPPPSA
ncbi:hypothetical protein Y032_0003g1261 [Ancylostoma ceylanicum]|uniref:Uncharacterized protein n=1 Tax=Ancylostoma ceylanicum TaxID=53326 RepID=A0A016VWN3_9BILA|nr:hypothetical protein Y032_0003g1261 [Ancylostoma ceylanicum]